jgi:hypothetical protein
MVDWRQPKAEGGEAGRNARERPLAFEEQAAGAFGAGTGARTLM